MWFNRKRRERKFHLDSRSSLDDAASGSFVAASGADEDDGDEFQELLIAKKWNGPEKGSGVGKKITRSKVGSVENLAAFVAPPNRQHLSGRHVKYQTRQKMKAPHTNWVSINSQGGVCKVAADKRAITKAKELGVTTRELRMFDQVYGHFHNNTTRILVRENALLFVMEGYRLIITKDEVFIPLFGLPAETLSDLVKELEYVLTRRSNILKRIKKQKALGEGGQRTFGTPQKGSPGSTESEDDDEEILPFELRVFEVALGRVVGYYKDMIVDLDEACHPALEALTKSVDKVTLDHVRALKNKQASMTKKLEAVVEELERIMDDDDDMKRMILSEDFFEDPDLMESVSGLQSGTPRKPVFQAETLGGTPDGTPGLTLRTSLRTNDEDHAEHEVDHALDMVENLLEFYFSILDHAFDCLKTLEEIIDNTEEMINIELDTARNRLIKLEIMLTGCTFTFTIYAVVAGVLGENLDLPESIVSQFWIVNLVTIAVCSMLLFGLFMWCRFEGLL
ncbi:Magnesium transporter [Chloropicon primus]|uniref:Magnesium transporter n=1 Tax=Chloropicon primus TaxID=1764295 RepID=A0A5B8MN24_9CHLO|nr:Magnesium transporter [Chloropicon primus]UPR01089.1 Magnesium transporter [Chloropicon primus]|mmetsp:Transcript_7275/g.21115  ORF Transcript_7275/g.21115 Transcript_7275/m.21115 type:complete len:508 (+) Transcript_7275:238-1761(+)|eukprot:QDZ21869.1 Magnesium transporter [Chloropicon primus]